MKRTTVLMAAALLLGVAGCSEEKPAAPQAETPAATEPSTPPATENKTSETPAAKPAAQESSSDVSQAAIDACVAAIDAETDGDVAVLSTEFSQANSMVMVGVGANKAPWKCLVGNDGKGAEISFAGTDGDQVEPPAEAEPPATSGSEVSQAAIDACLTAVKAETSEPDQAVLSSEFSEANSMVMVGVGPGRAPWKCLVSNDGVVAEVMSTVDEGAL